MKKDADERLKSNGHLIFFTQDIPPRSIPLPQHLAISTKLLKTACDVKRAHQLSDYVKFFIIETKFLVLLERESTCIVDCTQFTSGI